MIAKKNQIFRSEFDAAVKAWILLKQGFVIRVTETVNPKTNELAWHIEEV